MQRISVFLRATGLLLQLTTLLTLIILAAVFWGHPLAYLSALNALWGISRLIAATSLIGNGSGSITPDTIVEPLTTSGRDRDGARGTFPPEHSG